MIPYTSPAPLESAGTHLGTLHGEQGVHTEQAVRGLGILG